MHWGHLSEPGTSQDRVRSRRTGSHSMRCMWVVRVVQLLRPQWGLGMVDYSRGRDPELQDRWLAALGAGYVPSPRPRRDQPWDGNCWRSGRVNICASA